MLFRKRKGHGGAPPHLISKASSSKKGSEFHKIAFDMMLKGYIYTRRGVKIRQFGVTVNGSTLLVTSGDVVSHEAYQALIDAGAIRPQEVKIEEENSPEE